MLRFLCYPFTIGMTIKAYRDYKRENILAKRIDEINPNELSGIKICIRTTRIPYIGFLNCLLPKHHSIKFTHNDVPYHFGYSSQGWKSHQLHGFNDYNSLDFEIPIEAYVEYKEIFNEYPVINNGNLFKDNIIKNTINKSPNTLFDEPVKRVNGKWYFCNCQTNLIHAIENSNK